MAGCAPVQCSLTVCSTEGGQVTVPGESTFTYNKGTVVKLVAEPENGYHFVSWSGDVGSIADVNAATTTITVDGDYSILANFALDVWEVRTWHDLDAIRNNLSGRYVLMNHLNSAVPGYAELASITANQEMGWQPIGNELHPFTGSFDGHGYQISDLFISRPAEVYVGLFGQVGRDAVIKDVNVMNITVVGHDYVGGLAGHSEGTVSNSYAAGNVTGREHVGGLVGHNGGMVNNSHSSGNVTGEERVGGLVGWNQAPLSNSYAVCSVTGNSSVGGLVGDNWHYEATISNSYATGSVMGARAVGGLVGLNYYGSVTHSYSTGGVAASSQVGGLVGYNKGTVSNSFWDTQTSGQTASDGGTGKTTTEMQYITTFSGAGWNIIAVSSLDERNTTYIWNIVNGVTYPFLSWQP
ncbi:MAG: GLUG motif-containing protein [Dehalococcoidia bacterium]